MAFVVIVVAGSLLSPPVPAFAASTSTVAATIPTRGGVVCANPQTLSNRSAARLLLFVGFTDETDARLQALGKSGVGGFFVMGSRKNTAGVRRASTQIAALRAGARSANLTPPFVAVDEEGGRVQRFTGVGLLPSARDLAKQDGEAIRATVAVHAKKLSALGITMDFAPVLDLDDRDSGIIADRSFSKDPAAAWSAASAFAAGLHDAGVTPVFKHFPGHGSANGDSHKGLVTTAPIATLRTKDMLPFVDAIRSGANVIMMGHLLVPGLTSGSVPTTWTPAAYQELRNLGFDGVIVTDDLGMRALDAEPVLGKRASRAIAAGADMVLSATTIGAEQLLDALEADIKTGALPRARVNEAVRRVQKLRC